MWKLLLSLFINRFLDNDPEYGVITEQSVWKKKTEHLHIETIFFIRGWKIYFVVQPLDKVANIIFYLYIYKRLTIHNTHSRSLSDFKQIFERQLLHTVYKHTHELYLVFTSGNLKLFITFCCHWIYYILHTLTWVRETSNPNQKTG